jgi:hypothetical protein
VQIYTEVMSAVCTRSVMSVCTRPVMSVCTRPVMSVCTRPVLICKAFKWQASEGIRSSSGLRFAKEFKWGLSVKREVT